LLNTVGVSGVSHESDDLTPCTHAAAVLVMLVKLKLRSTQLQDALTNSVGNAKNVLVDYNQLH